MFTLRPYQKEAVEATLGALHGGHHPAIAMATGAGKSLIIAALCQRLAGRILVATHVKELVQQNAEQCLAYDASQEIGMYSAGLGQRDTSQRIIFASVQSIYKRMDALCQSGTFRYVIVDESHLIAMQGSDAKMYQAVFAVCPDAQRIGLSATPYRLSEGLVYGPPPCWFDVLAYEAGIKALTPEYLAPLRGVLTAHDIALSDLSQVTCDETLVDQALEEACTLAAKRRKWLVFGVDIAHVELITSKLAARGIAVGMVTGKTDEATRDSTIAAFRRGELRALVNCLVFTTGFDVPEVDCIILMRPSQSKGLITQCLGRGTRKAESKRDCLVLDYVGAIERFRPLDELYDLHRSPQRVAKDEARQRAAEAKRQRELTHDRAASRLDPMAEDSAPLTIPVLGVSYQVLASRNPKYAGRDMLKVTYRLNHPSIRWVVEWVCCEYTGYPRQKAATWFARREVPMPATARQAEHVSWQYPRPTAVVVCKNGKYWQVMIEQFAEKE